MHFDLPPVQRVQQAGPLRKVQMVQTADLCRRVQIEWMTLTGLSRWGTRGLDGATSSWFSFCELGGLNHYAKLTEDQGAQRVSILYVEGEG